MKVFHIDEFKCTLCSNWFCPPFNLPYRLKCTHSICTNCLEKSVQNKTNQIICPQDLEVNKISEININQSTKKALQRLLKQHKNFTQTNHLECIKSLSMNFDELLDSKQIELKNLSTLIDQIFENQIRRLRQTYEKIKIQINRPFRIVNDWKQVVRNYLRKVKALGPNIKGCVNQFNHYIQEGRKIKLDLNEYLKQDFRHLIDYLLVQPQVCFTHSFSIFDQVQLSSPQQKFSSLSKFQTLGKKTVNTRQIYLQNGANNFEQSSIRLNKNIIQQPLQHSNKMSLFEELIHSTPKNSKSFVSQIYQDNKKTPLKEMAFISANNTKEGTSNNTDFNEKQNYHNSISNKISLNSQSTSNYFQRNSQCNIQQSQKCYNERIREKIKNLRAKDRLQESMTKKSLKMGRSLQYSPQYVNYDCEGVQKQVFEHQYNGVLQLNQNMLSSRKDGNVANFHRGFMTNEQKFRGIQHQLNEQNQKQSGELEEQMLLDEKSNRKSLNQKLQNRNSDWQLQNLNFLKEWKINKSQKPEEELEIIQKYGGYNCQKEKNKYAKKIEENKVKQILSETQVGENYISLVGHSLVNCNLSLLLSQINWNHCNIEIVKLIKTSLNDLQLNQLLNFLARSNVHTLMLSYNSLSQLSLDALLNFVQINSKLKNVYLPKNNINLLKGNARTKINLLKQKGINLYI